MGECLALSSGCPGHPGCHLNADCAILEVVDEEYHPVPLGQRGAKVLVTNLYNSVQPFIRYEVDDAVTMSATQCPCGSILPLVDSIEGRSKDKLWIKREGRYQDLPYYLFLAALHNELDMAEHQVVQKGVNRYTLRAKPLPTGFDVWFFGRSRQRGLRNTFISTSKSCRRSSVDARARQSGSRTRLVRLPMR
jgi:phenylacetate-coenzyme A ligase PaaK-like adenylate-forming protein